jgi:photosystem II stability/assembly factor-like uncharacterized protein
VSGTSWEEVLNSQEFLGTSEKVYVRWLTVAPSNSDFVYALASIKYYDQGILLISTDGGDTWRSSNSEVDGKSVCLAVDPHDPLKLYVGTWYSGVYRSNDGGSTWQPINTGLPSPWAVFRSIAIDPSDTQHIYLGVAGQVYQSTNGGDSWDQVGGALTATSDANRIAIAPTDPDGVYAAVWGEGVYKLTELGFKIRLPLLLKNTR